MKKTEGKETMTKRSKPAETKPVQHVTEVLRLHDDDWKVAFQTSSMRVSFCPVV